MQTASTPELVTTLAGALRAELIETHISWVLLAGDTAYKIKKPVHLPFVDYSSLKARLHFCEEELRLNRRLAPSLYLGISRITGPRAKPDFDGSGPVLEYAVRMCRFAPGALFSERLARSDLRSEEVDQLAETIAAFHEASPRADPASGFSMPEGRRSAALAALGGLHQLAGPAQSRVLRDWLQAEAATLAPLWSTRRADGHVRECHGDLHLANVVSHQGQVLAFDCIEFDAGLRWIDILDDAAFVVMDFWARSRPDLAFRFLNAWLDRTGDHAGLPALRFSVVYRALVRAQVEHLRSAGSDAARRYLETAMAWTRPGKPGLWITHGLPGSGKTHVSGQVLEREGAIRLRSDVERKRLYGLGMLENSRTSGVDLYGGEATARTYRRLLDLAGFLLDAGYPVILDAAFLRRDEREQARALAAQRGVPFSILHCEAPLPVLRERLRTRCGDASEADGEVLDRLRDAAEPLSHLELAFVHAASAPTDAS